jgi:hypothetical protein
MRSRVLRHGLLAMLLVSACGPSGAGDDGTELDAGRDAAAVADAGSDSTGGGGSDGPGPALDGPPAFFGAVYAHSSSDLYKVDPDSLAVSHVAAFVWPAGSLLEQMTDIALDKDGNMIGVSFGKVFAVNKDTGACTFLANLDRDFNGLSFVPADEISTGQETLVGAASDGSLYRIDKNTGQSAAIGMYGGGFGSSGDLVSVTGFGTIATATSTGATDILVRVDPNTGVATPIGDTGVADIWGLGYWAGKIFGFTESGQFVLVDRNTGVATVVSTAGVSWWGAGVTTSAPVID